MNINVNGKSHALDVEPEMPLLWALRDELNIKGPKFGCGLQQCSACMVLVDDQAVPTCLSPCETFQGKKIETIEGLKQGNKLHPVQEAFVQEQAAQCGYCLNGMLISAVSLLRSNNNPSEEEIKVALNSVICRCGTHSRFIKAVKKVSSSNI